MEAARWGEAASESWWLGGGAGRDKHSMLLAVAFCTGNTQLCRRNTILFAISKENLRVGLEVKVRQIQGKYKVNTPCTT